jgi:hypothetical protein
MGCSGQFPDDVKQRLAGNRRSDHVPAIGSNPPQLSKKYVTPNEGGKD